MPLYCSMRQVSKAGGTGFWTPLSAQRKVILPHQGLPWDWDVLGVRHLEPCCYQDPKTAEMECYWAWGRVEARPTQ